MGLETDTKCVILSVSISGLRCAVYRDGKESSESCGIVLGNVTAIPPKQCV